MEPEECVAETARAIIQRLKNGENGATRTPAGQFLAGHPGGPGRPRGSRNKAALAVEALLDGEAETLTRKAIAAALEGDGAALRLIMTRLVPPAKDRPLTFALPPLRTAADAVAATAAIAAAVADGSLSTSEAAGLSRLVGEFVRALVAHDYEVRLTKLEQAREGR